MHVIRFALVAYKIKMCKEVLILNAMSAKKKTLMIFLIVMNS